MSKIFRFFGGRRIMLTGFLGVYGAAMHKLFPAEIAMQLTEYVGWAVSAFILGESGADAVGRLKKE